MSSLCTIEGVKKTIFGPGAVNQLGKECKALKVSRALLVMDRALSEKEICLKAQELLKSSRVRTFLYPEITPEPSPTLADMGTELAKKEKVACVIAIGGGSTMDVAKAIAVLVKNEGKAVDYIGLGLVKKQGLPTIMVPTTAGTGSEVTFTSVFTMRETRTKGGINSPFLYPHTAILDPELTLGLSPEITASTGMDALTHAIEGYTATVAEPLADAAALYAVELIVKYLRTAVSDGQDMEARAGMLLGSLLAGISFSHSDVAAVHCIAEALGGKYDAPHGVCNAVVLPEIMAYNMDYCLERYARIASAMGLNYTTIEEGAGKAVAFVRQLASDVKLPSFQSLGVREEDFDELAQKSAMNGSNPDNPRPMKKDDYVRVLKTLWG